MKHVIRHTRHLPMLALAVLGLPLAAQAQTATRPAFIEILIIPDSDRPDLLRPVTAMDDENEWVTSADYPAAAIKAGLQGWLTVRVSVGANNGITGCTVVRGDAGALLQQFACRKLREKGRFRHALSAAGTPVASAVEVQISFNLDSPILHPPAPPTPPPGGRVYEPGIRMTKEPDWAAFVPPGRPNGDVAVSVSVYPPLYGRPESRYCTVTASTGDKALNDATCAAVKAAEYEQISSTRFNDSLQMLVRWKNGEAHYEIPSQPRVTPLAITGGEAAVRPVLAPGAVTEIGWAKATFYPGGKIDCLMVSSTGRDATDRAICQHLRTKVRFAPEKDIFGRDIVVTRYFRYEP